MHARLNSQPVARVCDLSLAEFRSRIEGPGLGVRIGPFDLRLVVHVQEIIGSLYVLYAWYPVLEGERVYSCHATLRPVTSFRQFPFRKVRLEVDGFAPHADAQRSHALTVLEWGINLVIALRFQCYLMLHTAALERNGKALLLPAAPGDGKTTLCAALAHRGWRLLSDEFGVLRPGAAEVLPLPRPMPLKNQSISVIRAFEPQAVLGPEIVGTRKGTVAHVQPPRHSVELDLQPALARWLVFPRWQAGTSLQFEELTKAEAFMRLATNAFNYEMHGEAAFESVRDVVAQSRCLALVYSELDQAVDVLTRIADADDPG